MPSSAPGAPSPTPRAWAQLAFPSGALHFLCFLPCLRAMDPPKVLSGAGVLSRAIPSVPCNLAAVPTHCV
eukprot:10539203-Karenia_brevis.AAC.1